MSIDTFLEVKEPGPISVIETAQVLTGILTEKNWGETPSQTTAGTVLDYRIREWTYRAEDINKRLIPAESELAQLVEQSKKSVGEKTDKDTISLADKRSILVAISELTNAIQPLFNARRALYTEIEAGGYSIAPADEKDFSIAIYSGKVAPVFGRELSLPSADCFRENSIWVEWCNKLRDNIYKYEAHEKSKAISNFEIDKFKLDQTHSVIIDGLQSISTSEKDLLSKKAELTSKANAYGEVELKLRNWQSNIRVNESYPIIDLGEGIDKVAFHPYFKIDKKNLLSPDNIRIAFGTHEAPIKQYVGQTYGSSGYMGPSGSPIYFSLNGLLWGGETKQIQDGGGNRSLVAPGVFAAIVQNANTKKQSIDAEIATVITQIAAVNQTLQAYQVIEQERYNFLKKWNDQYSFNAANRDNRALQSKDPLVNYINNIDADVNSVIRANLSTDGYLVDNGESIFQYLRNSTPRALIIPKPKTPFNEANGSVLLAFASPKLGGALIKKPLIRLVESYGVTLTWDGYSLGELSRSYNLTPGEQRTITVTKTTRVTERSARESSSETTTTSKISSSFEQSLQNEFSLENKIANQRKVEQSNTTVDRSEREHTKSKEATSVREGSAGASYGVAKADLSMKDTTVSKTGDKKFDALLTESELRDVNTSDQSQVATQKELKSVIEKVAREVSESNHVTFKESFSIESLSENQTSEQMVLTNPNSGTTINYHLFQLQNIYRYSLEITDIKVVVDTGIEIIENSGVTEKRVLDIDEIENFIKLLESDMAHISNITGYTEKLKSELNQLKNARKSTFFCFDTGDKFKRTVIPSDEQEIRINSGAYHIDSEVGLKSGVDQYLAKQRELELQLKEQKLALEKVKVEIRRPYPPALPSTTTHGE